MQGVPPEAAIAASTPQAQTGTNDDDGLSDGSIAGIVVGSVAGVMLLLLAAAMCVHRRRRHSGSYDTTRLEIDDKGNDSATDNKGKLPTDLNNVSVYMPPQASSQAPSSLSPVMVSRSPSVSEADMRRTSVDSVYAKATSHPGVPLRGYSHVIDIDAASRSRKASRDETIDMDTMSRSQRSARDTEKVALLTDTSGREPVQEVPVQRPSTQLRANLAAADIDGSGAAGGVELPPSTHENGVMEDLNNRPDTPQTPPPTAEPDMVTIRWPGSDAKEVLVVTSADNWQMRHELQKMCVGVVARLSDNDRCWRRHFNTSIFFPQPRYRPDGSFETQLKLPTGQYEYKFVVDGQWTHLQDAPQVSNGFGSFNNVISSP